MIPSMQTVSKHFLRWPHTGNCMQDSDNLPRHGSLNGVGSAVLNFKIIRYSTST